MIEKYDAVVVSIDDPDQRGRIMVACVGLLNDELATIPQWIEPNLQWGFFVVPDVGEIVEIETIEGNDQDESFGQSSLENMEIRWTGRRSWTDEEVEDGEARSLPEYFKENYGKRRGFATPNGHILFFDDTKDKEKIELVWIQGDKTQRLSFDETGSIILENSSGSKVILDSENAKIQIIDEHGNEVVMEEDLVSVNGTNEVKVTGSVANIETTDVNLLSGASEAIVKGDSFKATYDVHTHSTAFGPSGPPAIPLPPTNLSTNAKVGG